MQLTETKPNPLFVQFLPQTQKEAEQLEKMTNQLKTKHRQLTHLFDQASSALNTIQSLTALVPQTFPEIRAALEALFQSEQSSVVETQPIPSTQPQTSSHPLIEVADQLLPLLKSGKVIANSGVARLMTEALGGSDAEGHWLWKDAYEALEIAQIRFIQERGKELLNQANSAVVLGEIERLHRLCPTQTRRSETSIQLQQFSTPLPLAYLVQVAAQITPDDLVLEPSAGTGLLAVFAQIGGAQLLLNEICPKRRDILSEVFPKTPLFGYNAEQIDDYLDLKWHPTVVVMNPPFSASPRLAKRNQFATLKHLRSALARLTEGGRLVAITANWFSPLSPEWRDSFMEIQRSATVVFSCPMVGQAYAKQGTTMETRLTVIDKIAPNNPDKFANCLETVLSLSDLLNEIAQFVPERRALIPMKLTQTKADLPSNGLPQSFLQGEIPFDNSLVLLESKPKPQLNPSKKSAIPASVTLGEGIELTYTTQDWTGSEREISDGLYETYEPQSVLITEASDHPSPLVQSAAMASVAPPKPTYQPQLPQRLIRENILSTAQLESVIYAGESHRQFLKGNYQVDDTLDRVSVASEDDPKPVQFRRGYFIGDSTGVGKGR